ncbi:MAG: hypothetical protein RR326_01145 [Stenotrophomonas sp.]
MIVIRTDMTRALEALKGAEKQSKFAAAVALTRTAKIAQANVVQAMRANFDRPLAYTLNSTRMIPARRDKLAASVWLKDRQSKVVSKASHYLYPETFGGRRERKAYETALLRVGVLRSNEFTVPADGYPLDAYGNIPVGVIRQILSQLKAAEISKGSTQNKTASARSRRAVLKAGTYFVSMGKTTGNPLPRGIYQRIKTGFGWATRMVMKIVVGKPRYQPRLPFFKIGQDAMAQHFEREYDTALKQALVTAR